MAYSVAQRTREMGIRIALGAGTGQVVTLVLRGRPAARADRLLIGALAGFGAGRLIASLLYNVKATDPIVFLVVSWFFLSVALLACWLPARKATQVDPIEALRTE